MSLQTPSGFSEPETLDDLRQGPTTIVYDGECPFCSSYVTLLRLREAVGPVRLINARELPGALLDELRGNHDLDAGMLFIRDGSIYHGDTAVHHLALLSSPSGLFNRLNALVLGQERLARRLYPALRLGRRLALALRGSGKIHR